VINGIQEADGLRINRLPPTSKTHYNVQDAPTEAAKYRLT
jgi:hypothetical protein